MPHDLMVKCQQNKLFLRDGIKIREWTEVAVSTLTTGANNIRCIHCHGAIRVHMRQVKHGPADHVEHLSRQYSENCKGGSYFKGVHQMSLNPVL